MSFNEHINILVHHDDSVEICEVFVSPKGVGSKSVPCHFVRSWPSSHSSAPSSVEEAAGTYDGLHARARVGLFVSENENTPAKKCPGCNSPALHDTKPIASPMASMQSTQRCALPGVPTPAPAVVSSHTLPAQRDRRGIPNPTLEALRAMDRKRKERNINLTFWQMMDYSSVPASDEEDSREGVDGIPKVKNPLSILVKKPSTVPDNQAENIVIALDAHKETGSLSQGMPTACATLPIASTSASTPSRIAGKQVRENTKVTKYRPTKMSNSARNLFGRDYVSKNPNTTTQQFSQIWDSLDITIKQEYEQKAAKLRSNKAAAAAAVNNATAT